MKCATSKCKFACHTNKANNGGAHCCFACKSNHSHGPACEKKLASALLPDTQKLSPRCIGPKPVDISSLRPATQSLSPAASGRAWFTAAEIASIYKLPPPNPATNVVVGVLSFGGGLYGTVDANGVLTNGDVQAYWTYIGIPANKHPRVIIVPINGAKNLPNPNDGGATYENSLDVQTIGGCCPSANLTIILYISPNSLSAFPDIITKATTTAHVINGVSYKPSIISISWGAPEIYYNSSLLTTINQILAAATASGINICSATGDFGSNNGVGGTGSYTDFPSSSPFNTAVGGTNLFSPNNVYDSSTVEKAWTNGGGAISAAFPKPSYQSVVSGSFRHTPDIALVADPATGVLFNIGGSYFIFGGTSVAAPVFAAFLAAGNIQTFVNPSLYTAPTNCFNDITVGSNGAFITKTGYDNCTGLGSINGKNLLTFLSVPVLVSGLTLNISTLSLVVGGTRVVSATITPTMATNKSLTWSSSNTNVATVSSSGLVTGVAGGNANIVCSTTDGSQLTASVAVTVTAIVQVTGVSVTFSKSSTIRVGTTLQLNHTISPPNATNKAVTWSSNNGNVTVSRTGLVTGRAIGKSNVVCRSVNGGFTATTVVTVTIPVSSVRLATTSFSMALGQTYKLVSTVLPANAANKTVSWISSDPLIATINSVGLITAIKRGRTTITCTTADAGLIARATVTVN